MTLSGITTTRLSLIGFVSVLALAWLCYRPALSGDFQLDDAGNLSGLQQVANDGSMLEFVLSGTAGPTGRPLALLSFALQAEQWEHGARSFLAVNVLIHLVNATLLAALLYGLTRAQGVARDRSAMIAALASGIWVLMPLLASASLLVIQRMTTLSATFVLLGLIGYLAARRRIEQAPRPALAGMGASLVVGTVLAALTKETGLLLPLYALVLELTVLRRPASVPDRRWRAWQGVFLGLPLAVVLAYLGWRANYPDWTVARHGYTAGERLLSELPLLWLYLEKALYGLPSTLGVFQTPPGIRRSLFDPVVIASLLAWAAAIGGAVWMRRRQSVFALAVFWFLAGHLLESSVLSLELYFEHRNYLPVVGPVYAVAVAAVLVRTRARYALLGIASAWLVCNALFLYYFASLFGDPSAASRFWALRYPDSARAVTTMASYQLTEEGPVRTLRTLDNFVATHPQFAYLRIQELNLRCLVMPDADHDAVLTQLDRSLPAADFTLTAGRMLSELLDTVATRSCRGVSVDTVAALAERLRRNPRYDLNPTYNRFHHKLLAAIARRQGDLDRTLDELAQASAFGATSELNMLTVITLASAGDLAAARTFIEAARAAPPLNPFRAIAWNRDLDNLGEYIRELERYSENEH